MSDIFAFSNHHPAVTPGDIERRVSFHGGCFDTHHIHWQKFLILDNGRRSLSHVSAPDADSARMALRHTGFAVALAWPMTCFSTDSATGALFAPIELMIELRRDNPFEKQELSLLILKLAERGENAQPRGYLSLDSTRVLVFSPAFPDCTASNLAGLWPENTRWRQYRCRQITTCVDSPR